MPNRAETVRYHLEEAAAVSLAATQASGPARQELNALAADQEAYADMARHGEYPTDLED